jgi:hypothetical protein
MELFYYIREDFDYLLENKMRLKDDHFIKKLYSIMDALICVATA